MKKANEEKGEVEEKRKKKKGERKIGMLSKKKPKEKKT